MLETYIAISLLSGLDLTAKDQTVASCGFIFFLFFISGSIRTDFGRKKPGTNPDKIEVLNFEMKKKKREATWPVSLAIRPCDFEQVIVTSKFVTIDAAL